MFFLSGSGLFKKFRSPVTSRSLVPSGPRGALRGRLPADARSLPTFPRELPCCLPPASPFRRPFQRTARTPERRSETSSGPGFAETGRQLTGAGGGLRRGGRTAQGERRRALGAPRTAPSTPWTGSRSRRALSAGQRAPGASRCSSPWSVHRMLPDPPLPHFIWLPAFPRACCPGAQKLLQARRITLVPAPRNNPPPSAT